MDNQPIKLNGAFYMNSVILKFLVASAVEAELSALFHIAKTVSFFVRPYPMWVTPNQRHLYIATMQRQLVLEITLSSTNNCSLWKCNISG